MPNYSRKELILKLIVEHFIITAEPVGSQTLIAQFNLPYSSATIRNEMADLESLGYLEKPHTSAGRIPSSKGYRYYIDNLREKDNADIQGQLQPLFVDHQSQINDVIKHGCEILSQMTNLTSIMLGPDAGFERMSKIQLVPLSEHSAVAIFITDKGHVENKTIFIPKSVEIKDLETCVEILNDRLQGTPINEVIEKSELIKPILAERVKQHELVYKAFIEAFLKFSADRMSVFGRANILEQPEFINDIDKLKKVVALLDNQSAWKKFSQIEGISVRIGEENIASGLDDVSVVTANFKASGGEVGTIALIGPTRMDYNKVLSALEYMMKEIDELLDKED